MVLHPDQLHLGDFSDIGAFTLIQAACGVWIGDHVQIGANSALYSVDSEGGRCGGIRIGAHAKIGAHCAVMPGVVIGEYAVVGAHSFINKDIPARALAYGVPVEIVKENYASDIEGEGGCGIRWLRAVRISHSNEDGGSWGGCHKG